MLFNADKSTKGNLLQEYKRDAELYRSKKQEDKLKRIQEERSYMEQINQMNSNFNDQRNQEKQKRISEAMNEYGNVLRNDTGKLYNGQKLRNYDNVNINTYGVSSNTNNVKFQNNINNNISSNNNFSVNVDNIKDTNNTSNIDVNNQYNFNNNNLELPVNGNLNGKNYMDINYNYQPAYNPTLYKDTRNVLSHSPTNLGFQNKEKYEQITRTQKVEAQRTYRDYLDGQVKLFII